MRSLSPEFDWYQTASGRENILRFNSKERKQLLIIEAFFEEKNFLRKTAITLARRLATRGIGIAIPDLPGAGESILDIAPSTLEPWLTAITDSAVHIGRTDSSLYAASFRGGALLDAAVPCVARWRFEPIDGAGILRPFERAQRLSSTTLASFGINPALAENLADTRLTPSDVPLREVSLPDGIIAPWRLAEPSDDPALANWLADDLIAWLDQCDAR